MSLQYRFNEVLEFPCPQDFRIIVSNQEGNLQKLLQAINEIITVEKVSEKSVLSNRQSKNGQYISYNIRVMLASAQEMEKLYKDLLKLECVQHIL